MLDPRWPKLLAAARVWRASVIPGTSTSLAGPTAVLIEAIQAFDGTDETGKEPR